MASEAWPLAPAWDFIQLGCSHSLHEYSTDPYMLLSNIFNPQQIQFMFLAGIGSQLYAVLCLLPYS